MNRFARDFKNIISKHGVFDELAVITGSRSGDTICGMFSMNFSKHTLDGRPLQSSGPIFLTDEKSAEGVEAGDMLRFNGVDYTVEVVKVEVDKVTIIEFSARLVGTKKESGIGQIF